MVKWIVLKFASTYCYRKLTIFSFLGENLQSSSIKNKFQRKDEITNKWTKTISVSILKLKF